MGGCKRCEETMIDKSMYWNPNRILSYNRVLNYVIGGRGIGKTTGMKIYTTNRFLKHNEQFMYLKRYKTDIKNLAPKFFNTVKSEFVDAQVIEELPITLECKVEEINQYNATLRIVAEIVNVSADESILDADGKIDPDKLCAISYDPANRAYLRVGGKAGTAFSDGNQLK